MPRSRVFLYQKGHRQKNLCFVLQGSRGFLLYIQFFSLAQQGSGRRGDDFVA